MIDTSDITLNLGMLVGLVGEHQKNNCSHKHAYECYELYVTNFYELFTQKVKR
jgi:hypothetical protein